MKRKESDALTAACERGGNIDRVALFAKLRELWLSKGKKRTFGDLCEFVGVHKSTASSYATGNDRRSAPWWVLLRMLASLGMEIRINADGIVLGKRTFLRKNDILIPHTVDGDPLVDLADEVVG